MNEIRHADHGAVAPLIDENCTVLILGSMLSPKSAEQKFYYAHPQNRFWRVLASVFGEQPVYGIADRTKLALSHGIALWDVIRSCDLIGARDDTIKNVVYNDIEKLTNEHPSIERIYATGSKAYSLLMKYAETVNSPVISAAAKLPSTSPQNFGCSLEKLIEAYSVIKTA